MARIKNITNNSLTLQMYRTDTPYVLGVAQNTTLVLKPYEDVDETLWKVTDVTDPSYNEDIINDYIKANILTRI